MPAHTAWCTRTGRNCARRSETSTKPFTACRSEFSFESSVFLELPKPCLALGEGSVRSPAQTMRRKQLVKGVGYGTVEDQLCRIMAAEENKMDVDVGVRCYAGTGVHNRRQEVGC